MKKLMLLLAVTALGACGSRTRVSSAPPPGCDKVAAHLRQQIEGAKEADLPVASEVVPRALNVRHVERRLDDTVRSLPIDSARQPVVLRYQITAQGRPDRVSVAKTSGSAVFDAAVVWSLGFAEFAPALINGCPVTVWVEQPFTPRVPRRRRAPAPPSGVQAPPRP